ncbi:ABC transporter [Dietzia lutea]|uniref:ABC transporter n=1 Tax=Dietzia lutea TaxID=546160 RepID=A0A2S1RCV9_9ACTN|nr:ABC transporter [Dietzia lutea]AWH94061.1 ABC transporter [Dietzia lutea]
MQKSRTIVPLAFAVAVALAFGGCASGTDEPDTETAGTTAAAEKSAGSESPDEDDTGAGHGAVEGAEEVAEPQLHLVSIDGDGAVGMVDLLDGTQSELGGIDPPSAVTSDGRYLFVETAMGVEIVDSGVWTWDHVDHFHFYRTAPQLLGPVPGSGTVVVATSANATTGGTGLFFPESGEAVLLDNQALSRGRVEELFRVETDPHEGLTAPLAEGALVTSVDDAGAVTEVLYHDADGTPVDGVSAPCPDATGTITSRVGVVVGCADGAVLATADGGEPTLEHIRYPEGTDAPPATDFRNRKGRPTAAALAGDTGFWLLDTREKNWQYVPTDQPLLQVSASDDADEHVVALDGEGRIRVYSGEDGTELAASEPLLAKAVADPEMLAGVDLVVDRERAYVNDPATGVVHEIDYRGDVRVARSLETPTAPDFFSEAGR